MTTDQERWNQAQRNTDNAMRGTQPHAAAQAQKTTGKALHGTYSSRNQEGIKRADAARDAAVKHAGKSPDFSSQQGHDNAYKAVVGHGLKDGSYKGKLDCEPKIAAKLLDKGAKSKELEKSIANHSPAVAKNVPAESRDDAAAKIVAKGQKMNMANQPRDERQNIKPGHEVHRGPGKFDPKPSSPSPEGGSAAKGKEPSTSQVQQAQIAAWKNSESRGR